MLDAFKDVQVLNTEELNIFHTDVIGPKTTFLAEPVESFYQEGDDKTKDIKVKFSFMYSKRLKNVLVQKARRNPLVSEYALQSPAPMVHMNCTAAESGDPKRKSTHANMRWHVDGSGGQHLVTWVYVYYEHDLDISAQHAGGAILYSRRPDGKVQEYTKDNHSFGKSRDYLTYFPTHNSAYAFCGSHTMHAVTSIHGHGRRFAVVVFFPMRQKLRVQLLTLWAKMCSSRTKSHICCKCFKMFTLKKNLRRHQRQHCV